MTQPTDLITLSLALAGIMALLFPLGMLLCLAGVGVAARRTIPVSYLPVALVLGAVAYFICGFALQYGGAGGLYPPLGDLAALRHEWDPLAASLGRSWGLLGLSGFFLAAGDDPGVYALFFFQAVLLGSALAIVAGAWAGRIKARFFAIYTLLFGLFLYPIPGNRAWGGGWLGQLGRNLGLGHGFVDFGGAGMVHATGGLAALAGLLAFGRRASNAPGEAPRVGGGYFISSLVAALGWLAAMAGSAVLWGTNLSVVMANALVAAVWAGAVALGYMAFATGQIHGDMLIRGLLTGLVTISGTAPFVSPPAAALIGAVAGLLVCFGTYFVSQVLSLDDPLGSVSVHGLGGIWGLLALGLFAEGRVGAGWNGVGLREYLGVPSQGVTGLLPAPGFLADTQQILAQVVGLVAITVWTVGLTLALLAMIGRVWRLTPEEAGKEEAEAGG